MNELAWGRVEKPETLMKENQQIQVKVMRVNHSERKISLSLKELSTNPWKAFIESHMEGEIVSGKVTRIADFGAFVEIEPGIEGLVHVTELSQHRVRRVQDAVQENQMVEAQILSMDPEARRISLSIRNASIKKMNAEESEMIEDHEIDSEEVQKSNSAKKRNFDLRGGL